MSDFSAKVTQPLTDAADVQAFFQAIHDSEEVFPATLSEDELIRATDAVEDLEDEVYAQMGDPDHPRYWSRGDIYAAAKVRISLATA